VIAFISARRIEDDPLGFRRDHLVEVRRLNLELLLQSGVHERGRAAAQSHHFGVADPVRRGDHHLVAGVQRRHQGIEDDVLAARADDGLRGLVLEVVLALELGGNGGAQFGNTQHRCVLCFAPADGGDGGFLDVVRRIEIRLADRQRDHILAGGFQVPGFLREHDGGARLDAGQGVGNEGHGTTPGKDSAVKRALSLIAATTRDKPESVIETTNGCDGLADQHMPAVSS
jgi:hypothetical protein